MEEAKAHAYVHVPWSPDVFVQLFADAAQKDDATSRLLMQERDMIERSVHDVSGRKLQMAEARRQIVRNSLHPHDTLFEDGKLRAIIDFEEVGMRELLRDVGHACHRFVRQYVVHQGKPWQETLPRGVKLFLQAYQEENSLLSEELRLMPAFIIDELLRKVASAARKISTQEVPGTYEKEVLKYIDLLKEGDAVGKEIEAFADEQA